jgi:hypothetical protein
MDSKIQVLVDILRAVVPVTSTQKWRYEIDLTYSCFRLEHADVIHAILSGSGHENLEEVAMDISIRLTVGRSDKIHRVHMKEKGATRALTTLLHFPENFSVCRECGHVRSMRDGKVFCESCLFLKVFSSLKEESKTACTTTPATACTICQEPAYRTVLPCGHVFHMTCLLYMDPERIKCPNCRTPLPTLLVQHLFGDVDYDDVDDDEEDDDEEY